MAGIRFALALFFLWLAYAAGIAAWDESTQAIASAQGGDAHAMLVAAFGGAQVVLLLGCAIAIVSGKLGWPR